ncbi:unnamed protein product [Plutella xylostella]|uniref:(diamondback moth) hypothetical protein n=1 Tax=Plutella xylostella TaxID=51655 RepID=A0A8S4FFA3_PLUXY|nr:unnamed protein product [Plutella xylostella]
MPEASTEVRPRSSNDDRAMSGTVSNDYRFQHNKIYTNIGEVLVSVNPYKTLDIYGAATMMQYRGREMFEVPPHVYAVADACQRVLRQQVMVEVSTCE